MRDDQHRWNFVQRPLRYKSVAKKKEKKEEKNDGLLTFRKEAQGREKIISRDRLQDTTSTKDTPESTARSTHEGSEGDNERLPSRVLHHDLVRVESLGVEAPCEGDHENDIDDEGNPDPIESPEWDGATRCLQVPTQVRAFHDSGRRREHDREDELEIAHPTAARAVVGVVCPEIVPQTLETESEIFPAAFQDDRGGSVQHRHDPDPDRSELQDEEPDVDLGIVLRTPECNQNHDDQSHAPDQSDRPGTAVIREKGLLESRRETDHIEGRGRDIGRIEENSDRPPGFWTHAPGNHEVGASSLHRTVGDDRGERQNSHDRLNLSDREHREDSEEACLTNSPAEPEEEDHTHDVQHHWSEDSALIVHAGERERREGERGGKEGKKERREGREEGGRGRKTRQKNAET